MAAVRNTSGILHGRPPQVLEQRLGVDFLGIFADALQTLDAGVHASSAAAGEIVAPQGHYSVSSEFCGKAAKRPQLGDIHIGQCADPVGDQPGL